MTTQQQNAALRRKVQAGEAEHQARAMSLPKALRLTLAKVANEFWGMPLAALGITTERRELDACAEVFDDSQLLLLLDGPEQLRAAAMLDASLVGALIQQQTMGKVFPDPGGDPRPMTATDAAMCAPLLDALLKRAAALPELPDERELLSGYRFGARSADVRQLMIALEVPEYQLFRLTLDIDRGARQGSLLLCFPLRTLPPPDKGPDLDDREETSQEDRSRNLNDTVMGLQADLNVSVARVSLPLKRISALTIGDTLDLGTVAFETATVMTRGGRRLSEGVLGQVQGKRAIRLKHAGIKHDTPGRRASDRAEHELPEVTGDGVVLPSEADEGLTTVTDETRNLPNQPDVPETPALDVVSELPDMSDLPGFDEEELHDLPQAQLG